jgi:hypothetical protein
VLDRPINLLDELEKTTIRSCHSRSYLAPLELKMGLWVCHFPLARIRAVQKVGGESMAKVVGVLDRPWSKDASPRLAFRELGAGMGVGIKIYGGSIWDQISMVT